jgi:hypothetical protein
MGAGRMKPMTAAELHKLLVDAVAAAHQELSSVTDETDPAVGRARDILTSAIDRVMLAANGSNPERADVGDVVADIHDRRRMEACSCPCHADGRGNREWPLLVDPVGRMTACSQCREDHERMAPRRDSAA